MIWKRSARQPWKVEIGETGKRDVPERIETYKDWRVFQSAMEAAMEPFQLTKNFPAEERYSMMDQMRCSFRSVCTNIAVRRGFS